MKSLKLTLLAIIVTPVLGFSQYVNLISLGNDSFTIDADSVGDYTQSASQLTFNSVNLGDSVYGTTVSLQNWSSYSDFGIRINTATNSAQPFRFEMYDSTYTGGETGKAVYGTTNSSILIDTNVIQLSFVSSTADMANIIGIGFAWDGTSTNDLVALNVAAIPEPSTYALMALGGLGLFLAARRRKVQA